MAWTQADIDTLDRAIASGTLSVRYENTQITYQSASEMLLAREKMKAEVQSSSGRPVKRFSYAAFSRE